MEGTATVEKREVALGGLKRHFLYEVHTWFTLFTRLYLLYQVLAVALQGRGADAECVGERVRVRASKLAFGFPRESR